ncbi:hypothetical protein KRR26_30720 [Corallococcus sp. M34]|uniref:hypothetical protein n=1 Tax=Citreicoccus inhibens TaxID=2849499 RepID=UPI001C214248|nr:hypothetical protein [Citreicoccus inhibens]MBU8899990.1 hypothetical protein [Citreicoccus inhibens]
MSAARGFVGLGVAAGALAVALACSGGLKVDAGNPYPCDFTQAVETRDTACPAAWRCGIDNHCQEDGAEAVSLGAPPSFEVSRRYPERLDGEARVVAYDPRGVQLLVGYTDGGVFVTNGRVVRPVLSNAELGDTVAFAGERVALLTAQGSVRLGTLEASAGQLTFGPEDTRVTGLRALRVSPGANGRDVMAALGKGFSAGEVDLSSGTYQAYPGSLDVSADAGPVLCGITPLPPCPGSAGLVRYLDVRPVSSALLTLPGRRDGGEDPAVAVPVVVTPEFFFWRTPPSATGLPGTWRVMNPEDPISSGGPESPAREDWLLRHSESAALWAVRRPVGNRDVLSTWGLRRTAQGPVFERAWDDCAPCSDGKLISFSPVSEGTMSVEVLCRSPQGSRSLFRVVASSVVSPLDTCKRQSLDAPVDFSEVASLDGSTGHDVRPGAVDMTTGSGAWLGGAHGQLWGGHTLSTLRPLYLDRVPMGAAPFADGLLTVTRDYFALDLPDLSEPARVGLSVVPPSDLGATEPRRLGALIEGIPGWLVEDSGHLVRVQRDGAGVGTLGVGYGPPLLAPSGEQATGPFLGQGMSENGKASLIISANDQVYVLEQDLSALGAEPKQLPGLLPRLTPEPGFPVRSLARDRTVSFTGSASPRVRGWLATGRSLFEFTQAADGKWALTPLPLGTGEPVAVWSLDGAGASYGRVGLRDGLVLRLPAGLPLTEPLQEGERVVGYASLAGWPVALTEHRLYAATEVSKRADGKQGLLRWKALEAPAELPANGLTGASIDVVKDPSGTETLYLFTHTGYVYRLGTAKH